MITTTTTQRDSYVASRFDALSSRFNPSLPVDDFRLAALLNALGPLPGKHILDLGCGKGRFARRLSDAGARVLALDHSLAMLKSARGIPRILATARRLPLPSASFDAVIAVEVLQHLHPLPVILREINRVLRPGGSLAVIDRNASALDPRRPWLPALAVKRIDQRRGLWMYPRQAPVQERWLWPRRFRGQLQQSFESTRVEFLLSPLESSSWLFQMLPRVRSFALWTARRPGGPQ